MTDASSQGGQAVAGEPVVVAFKAKVRRNFRPMKTQLASDTADEGARDPADLVAAHIEEDDDAGVRLVVFVLAATGPCP